MKIRLWAIGKPHDAHMRPGVDDFTERLTRYFPADWRIFAAPKNAAALSPGQLREAEGRLVLDALEPPDWLVALDERGTLLSSPKLADLLQARANESVRSLVFLIGGAYGLSAAVLDRARFTWSLSPLTFPHQLVRLILAEQLYRGCTILRGEKYHHE